MMRHETDQHDLHDTTRNKTPLDIVNDRRHLVSDGLLVDDELPLALVQDTQQLLVQNHLAQLQLHPGYRQLDQFRDMIELYAAERLRREPFE